MLLMVETGGVQLHEPMPASVTQTDIQLAARQVQRAAHLLSAARDAFFNGDLTWNTERHWAELVNLLQPGANYLEMRGEAFLNTRPDASHGGWPEQLAAHPADPADVC